MSDSPASDAKDSRAPDTSGKDFLRTIIDQDLAAGRYDEVVTRFPPEPNGYLHIGHAKSIVLNFGIAEEYGGRCHLRFDDTNPLTEDPEFAEAIAEDVRWLGYEWDAKYFAADYFDKLYAFAERLIEKGKAYVDSQSEEEIRENRGSVTEPGVDSPYRDRTPEENLDLLRRMKAGEFEDGAHVLRAKIDMAHPNMIMRDPLLYRIRHAEHYRAGDAWCIYPLYDYAHCLEDAIEEITHSFCTLEFENNREIYDWILDEVGFEEPRPHQYEFARLELEHTILSKRKLIRLVNEGHVQGWDDPRMPTIAGMRRRGIPPEAIREFCEMVGVTKANTRIDAGKLEYAVRDALNPVAPRVLCVLDPLKVTITNYEGPDEGETLDAPYWPRDIDREGTRPLPFGPELVVDRSDFAEEPPKGWKRLSPGASVRLRHAYVITVDEVVREGEGDAGDAGNRGAEPRGRVTELRCSYHPDSLGSNPEGVKVRGVVHWVSARDGVPCEVRSYDRLFEAADPDRVPEGEDFTYHLNPDSLVVHPDARIEPSVLDDPEDTRYQFERTGYFWRDPGPRARVHEEDAAPAVTDHLVFNRIVSLRDSWSKRRKEEPAAEPGAPGPDGTVHEDDADRPGAGSVVPDIRAEAMEPAGPEDRVSDERRTAREADPELAARFERYQEALGLSLDDADVLTGSRAAADFFEAALEAALEAGVGEGGADRADAGGRTAARRSAAEPVAAWIVNEVRREVKDTPLAELPFDGPGVGRLVALVEKGRLSRVAAKEVFAEMAESGGDPEAIMREKGLEKVDDPSVLEPLVERLMEENPGKVEAYRGGKRGLLGFFVGQVMRETGGSADPKLVKSMLEEKLS